MRNVRFEVRDCMKKVRFEVHDCMKKVRFEVHDCMKKVRFEALSGGVGLGKGSKKFKKRKSMVFDHTLLPPPLPPTLTMV